MYIRYVYYIYICLFTYTHSLGVHAEGPFINNERKGAHDHVHIQSSLSPTAILDCYGSLENVRIITLAPELPGAMDVITWLQDRGVVIALGKVMHVWNGLMSSNNLLCNLSSFL